MSWVQSGRFMDSAILALFVMIISATALQLFSRLWALVTRPDLAAYKVGPILRQIFRMNKSFDFNLTHVLLLSIVICLISLRPDSELEASKRQVKKSPTTKASSSKKDAAPRAEDAAREAAAAQ